MFDLISMFDAIKIPDVSDNIRFATQTISEYEMHRLNCRISQGDDRLEEVFTVIYCTGQETALHVHFIRVASTVIESLGRSPSHIDVMHAVNRLIELFRALKSLPKKSIQGLWAELFLIARSRKPSLLINAWHNSLDDRYDFNLGNQRIEVKSVSGRIRKHHFSLEQLQPPKDTEVLIASIFIERSGGGSSVSRLIDEIRLHAANDVDALLHLDQTNWKSAGAERFDRELAEQSLGFFEVGSIPAINPNLPREISEVHFKVDMTSITPISLTKYRQTDGLFPTLQRR